MQRSEAIGREQSQDLAATAQAEVRMQIHIGRLILGTVLVCPDQQKPSGGDDRVAGNGPFGGVGKIVGQMVAGQVDRNRVGVEELEPILEESVRRIGEPARAGVVRHPFVDDDRQERGGGGVGDAESGSEVAATAAGVIHALHQQQVRAGGQWNAHRPVSEAAPEDRIREAVDLETADVKPARAGEEDDVGRDGEALAVVGSDGERDRRRELGERGGAAGLEVRGPGGIILAHKTAVVGQP